MIERERAEAQQWACSLLAEGAALVLDVETTGLEGSIVELCVADPANGAILLDTLVDPGQVPIEPSATAVHGLTSADIAGAPSFPEVFAQLRVWARGRTLVAYNAQFDRSRLLHDCARFGIEPGSVADPLRWECAMIVRSEAESIRRFLRLNSVHRARGDVLATCGLIRALADGVPTRLVVPVTGDVCTV